MELLGCMPLEVGNHGGPIWEIGCAEMNVLSLKFIRTVLGAIIYKKVAAIEVFVVGQNEALVSWLAEVLFDPEQLV